MDLTPIRRILTSIRVKVQTIAAGISNRFAALKRIRISGGSLRRPLLAIPGAMAVIAMGLWAGAALLSTATSEANEVLTSAVIDTPLAVRAALDIPAVGTPVPAPVPPRAKAATTTTRVKKGAGARTTTARLERGATRKLPAARPTPTASPATAPQAPRATATAVAERSNEPKFHGTLSISSEPLGALVWVDGELVGPTPVVLKKVAAGSVVVRIESGGYERWSYAARVVANQETSIRASLQRASGQ